MRGELQPGSRRGPCSACLELVRARRGLQSRNYAWRGGLLFYDYARLLCFGRRDALLFLTSVILFLILVISC